jgi:hypothetical protein
MIYSYNPAPTHGPFFTRDPGAADTQFPHGYLWVTIDGNTRRLWICFESGNSPTWLQLATFTAA